MPIINPIRVKATIKYPALIKKWVNDFRSNRYVMPNATAIQSRPIKKPATVQKPTELCGPTKRERVVAEKKERTKVPPNIFAALPW